MFPLNIQQDAHEYLVHLINSAEDTFDQYISGTLMLSVLCGPQCPDHQANVPPIHGSVQEPIQVLSVAIGLHFSVQDMVNDHFQLQTLDDDYKCAQYGMLSPGSTTRTEWIILPEVLILQLKRFQDDDANRRGRAIIKNMTQVNVDSTLTLDDSVYDLIALVQHSGTTLRSGHYTAYIRNTSSRHAGSRWYLHDDEKTTLQREGNQFLENTSCVYLLFYKKRA